ncbi:hypothetical protein K1719_011190 [Acacia pycnantha]|nr:hypothetical protein K1719_011190 [Acacia pycnantha]
MLNFKLQLDLLTFVHHKRLLSFVGSCDEDGVKSLIYEYMAKWNLQCLLSGGTETIVTVVHNSLYVELEEVSISHKKPVGENSKSGAVVPSSPSNTYAKPNKSIKHEKM